MKKDRNCSSALGTPYPVYPNMGMMPGYNAGGAIGPAPGAIIPLPNTGGGMGPMPMMPGPMMQGPMMQQPMMQAPMMTPVTTSSPGGVSSNTLEQQLNTMQQQINTLERRVNTLENMVNQSNSINYSGTSQYNSSNYQMM